MAILDGISRIGVIGAGQMGRGIAQLASASGFQVTLADIGRDIAERGRTAIDQQLAKLVDKNKLGAEVRAQMLARITPCDLYGGELEAVELRHADVDENDRNVVLEQELQGLARRRGLDQVLVQFVENDLVGEQLVGLIVDQEDVDFLGHDSGLSGAATSAARTTAVRC